MGGASAAGRRFELASEAELAALAAALVDAGLERGVVYLEGELGTGKTAWARAVLRRLGVEGPVRSPTFTLLETYPLPDRGAGGREAAHLDLYRLADPEEVEYLGLRDLLAADPLLLVEWPERGAGHLPPPDLTVVLRYRRQPDGTLRPGREVVCRAHRRACAALLERAAAAFAGGG